MKLKKKVTWVEGRTTRCNVKAPKGYELVSVEFKNKKQRSMLDGSKCLYTRITTIWRKR